MSSRKSRFLEKTGGAQWADIWAWTEEIERLYGYSTKVLVYPPLSTQRGIMCSVQVEMEVINVNHNGKGSKVQRWRHVRYSGGTVEEAALQLVVELDRHLEERVFEAERTALAAGAML